MPRKPAVIDRPAEDIQLVADRLLKGDSVPDAVLAKYPAAEIVRAQFDILRLKEASQRLPQMLERLAQEALTGDVQALKLWFEVVSGKKAGININNILMSGDALRQRAEADRRLVDLDRITYIDRPAED